MTLTAEPSGKGVPRILKLLALWFILGAVYFLMEIVWRVPKGQWPHWTMWIVGGFCGIAVGGINQCSRFYNMPVVVQSTIGAVIVLLVEFCSGLLLNVVLGLDIWDYSGLPGNLLGQICLPFGLIWFCIMPFAIWLEDRLRWGFGWNGKAYSLWSIYQEFLFWYRAKGNPVE